ncbi:hypothetical protein [Nonomuraea rhodomycinica]|uniref:Uncharacterized protein n=1 Tax=Nonomuraea rhodomycinica TaxID=1712872 RepID=A0A7Y6IYS8_9ACTN|nr:hypothetical protein [Nonomuraea rhodomycinica]NUW45519.1 hypothetical protein [Nonomuraea rhodomycinica]
MEIDSPTSQDSARVEMCLAVAAVLLGAWALTQRSAVVWALWLLGDTQPWRPPWVFLPPLVVAAACFHVALTLWRRGTVPTVSALVAGIGATMFVILDLAWWL